MSVSKPSPNVEPIFTAETQSRRAPEEQGNVARHGVSGACKTEPCPERDEWKEALPGGLPSPPEYGDGPPGFGYTTDNQLFTNNQLTELEEPIEKSRSSAASTWIQSLNFIRLAAGRADMKPGIILVTQRSFHDRAHFHDQTDSQDEGHNDHG